MNDNLKLIIRILWSKTFPFFQIKLTLQCTVLLSTHWQLLWSQLDTRIEGFDFSIFRLENVYILWWPIWMLSRVSILILPDSTYCQEVSYCSFGKAFSCERHTCSDALFRIEWKKIDQSTEDTLTFPWNQE